MLRAAAWLLTLVGCGDGRARPPAARPTSATAVAQAAEQAADRAPTAGTPCVLGPLWTPCTLENRLAASGMIATLVDSAATLPMFDQPVRHYRMGRGELWVALFADTLDRARAVAALDSATASRRGGPRHDWGRPPLLIHSRNLAAVLLAPNENVAIRVGDALTAGLPALVPR